VLDAELKRNGVVVNNHLCEHFPYTRQGLYHLVRMHEIRSRQGTAYSEILRGFNLVPLWCAGLGEHGKPIKTVQFDTPEAFRNVNEVADLGWLQHRTAGSFQADQRQ